MSEQPTDQARALPRVARSTNLRSFAACVAATVMLGTLATACGERAATQVLQLDELNPRQWEVGDRVEVLGRNLPSPSDIRRISVTFRGTLARPGLAPCDAPVEVTLSDPPEGATTIDVNTGDSRPMTYAENTQRQLRLESGSHVEFMVTPELLRRLTSCPGEHDVEVPHATLTLGGLGSRHSPHGVTIRVEGLTSTHAVAGTLRGPTIDLHAPTSRRLAIDLEARHAAEHTLDFLGITLAQSHPTEGGLRIATVRSNSAAAQAGLVANDVLRRLDGLNLLSLPDFRPAPGASMATVTVDRGGVQDAYSISLEGLSPRAPRDLVAATSVLLVLAALTLAALRIRVAPSPRNNARRSPRAGFWVWVLQALRGAVFRRSQMLDQSPLADAVPWLLAASIVSSIVVAPFGHWLLAVNPDLSALYAMHLVALASATALVGAHKTVVDRVRAMLRALTWELPAIAALGCAVALSGSVRARALAETQGGWLWSWGAFRTPTAPLLLLLFSPSIIARARSIGFESTTRTAVDDVATHPRDRWLATLRRSAVWLDVLLLGWIASVAFLGAWQVPSVRAADLETRPLLVMIGVFGLMLKAWSVVFVVVWLRWLSTIRRAPTSIKLQRRTLQLAALAAIAGTSLWMFLTARAPWLSHPAVPRATFGFCVLCVVSAMAIQRSAATYASPSLDPFER